MCLLSVDFLYVHLAPPMSVFGISAVYGINWVYIPTDCPAHGAFLAADVSGLHLSGHVGFPENEAPAISKRSLLSLSQIKGSLLLGPLD